jgi:hypothetical protein
MRPIAIVSSVSGWLSLANAVARPINQRNTLVRRAEPIKMPAWNFANATTPDATPDGKVGAIIEPDLVDGKTGKDGGVVKAVKLGPYSLSPGQTKKGIVPAFALPCKDCYITAMQLTCEYPDGKEANINTGAW